MNVRTTSRIVLALAVLLGLLAALLVSGYVTRRTRPKAVVTRPEVVAVKDIPAGALITQQMVQLHRVPPQYLAPGAATAVAPLIGGIAKDDIYAGDPVLLTGVASGTAGSGLAFIVPPGDVAVTVTVDPVAGQDGMLRAGDRVDVLGILPAGKGIGTQRVTTALRSVQVLAVGQSTEPGSAAKGGYSTVTLAVNSSDAEEIVYLQRFESLTLTLQSPGHASTAPVSPFDQNSLAGVS